MMLSFIKRGECVKMSGKTAKSAFLILTAAALSFTAAVGGCKCVSADAEYHTAAEENTAYGFNTVNFENREYAIESVETASGGELDYDTFYGGTIIGAVINKYKNSVSPITVAAAVYDYSGNMLDVRAETFKPRSDVYGSEKFVFEKGLYIPSDKGECYVKVFVFDSAENLTPLAECKKITVTPPEKTLHIDDDVGGFAFFISGQYNTEINKYNYVSFEKNGNICDVPIYDDYKSIGKKSSVQMKKITNSAVFTDVSTHKKALYSSEKKYNYYLVSGTLKRDKAGDEIYFPMLRDYADKKDCALICILSDGSLKTCDGKILSDFAPLGENVSFELGIDLAGRNAVLYRNGEAVIGKIKIPDSFSRIDAFRFGINYGSGRGDLWFDDLKVEGLEKEYNPSGGYLTSVFYDDAAVKKYLSDKIAFNSYADIVLYGDTRYAADIYEENNEFYIESPAAENILGWRTDGEYIAVGDYAHKIGLNVYNDENGMMLLSEKPTGFGKDEVKWLSQKKYDGIKRENPSFYEAVSDYVFFERPEPCELKNMYSSLSANVHPKVIATKKDFERIKKMINDGDDAYFLNAADVLLKRAEKLLSDETVVSYTYQGYRMYNEAWKFRDRMYTLGFAYNITGNEEYAKRAWREFEAIFEFPDLNPAHIIDSGMFLSGIAVGYDWMYNAYTDEQLKSIENFAFEKCILPISGMYYGDFDYRDWMCLKWVSNFNTFINSGMINAAAAFADCDPDTCTEIISLALRSLEYTMKGFAPDGVWGEGLNYWKITCGLLADTFGTLESVFKTDFGISNYSGFAETVDFALAASSYGGFNNFHDMVAVRQRTDGVFAYLAKRFERPELYALRKEEMSGNRVISNTVGDSNFYCTELLNYTMPLANAKLSDLDILPNGSYLRGTELITFRSSYYKKDGLYISAHAGNVSGYHAHNDAGTFVFDHLGERWALDIGQQTYNTVKDVEAYRKRTEGHNTLTVNNTENFNQLENTFSDVTRFEYNENGGIAVMNMSDLYEDASKVIRGFRVSDNFETLTVRDEIELDKDSEVYWFMHTDAEIAVNGNTAFLTKNGKKMNVFVNVDGGGLEKYEVSAMDAVPLPDSPQPEKQDSNDGIRKLAIRICGNGKVNISVRFVPDGIITDNLYGLGKEISEWTLSN